MKVLFSSILLLISAVSYGQSDVDAVKAVVTSAYIEGIHNGGNINDIRKGFHPTFNMLRLVENEVKPLPIEEWITSIEKSRRENTSTPGRAEGKFVQVEVTGNAAIVKLELSRQNRLIFTDYLSLYKFSEGWKIVSKTFFRHP